MPKTKLIGEVTPEQILQWKDKYGEIFGIVVDGHICYLRKPDRKILGFASVAGKISNVKFNESLLNNAFIGGSEAIKTDDDLFLAACSQLGEIVTMKEAELVKF
jgi:hypothetical protein